MFVGVRPRCSAGLLLPVVESLVSIRVDPLGERSLNAMGRSSIAYRAGVKISCYRAADGRRLGRPLEREIEYTQLSAGREAETAANRLVDKLIAAMK